MIGRDLYFDYPLAVLLMPIVIILILFMLSLYHYRKKSIDLYCNPRHLSQLVFPRSGALTLIKNIAWTLAWIFGCLALMGPKGNLTYSNASSPEAQAESKIPKRRPHDIIFMVDTSASMNVLDARNGVSRLEDGKEIMEEFVSLLDGQNVGLDVFTAELSTIVPPTPDYLFMRLIIKEIFVNEGYTEGTNLEKSFLTLKEKTFIKPSSKLYSLIVFSDGGDNKLEELHGEAKKERVAQILAALPNAEAFNLRIFTIGLGSAKGGQIPNVVHQGKPVTSTLEPDILKQIAKKGRGSYYQASEWSAWNLAHALMRQIDQADPINEIDTGVSGERKTLGHDERVYDLYYQIPLGFALLLLLLGYYLPDTKRNAKL